MSSTSSFISQFKIPVEYFFDRDKYNKDFTKKVSSLKKNEFPHVVLHVAINADAKTIKKAAKQRLLQFHPDKTTAKTKTTTSHYAIEYIIEAKKKMLASITSLNSKPRKTFAFSMKNKLLKLQKEANETSSVEVKAICLEEIRDLRAFLYGQIPSFLDSEENCDITTNFVQQENAFLRKKNDILRTQFLSLKKENEILKENATSEKKTKTSNQKKNTKKRSRSDSYVSNLEEEVEHLKKFKANPATTTSYKRILKEFERLNFKNFHLDRLKKEEERLQKLDFPDFDVYGFINCIKGKNAVKQYTPSTIKS